MLVVPYFSLLAGWLQGAPSGLLRLSCSPSLARLSPMLQIASHNRLFGGLAVGEVSAVSDDPVQLIVEGLDGLGG